MCSMILPRDLNRSRSLALPRKVHLSADGEVGSIHGEGDAYLPTTVSFPEKVHVETRLHLTFGLATSFSLCEPMRIWLATHWYIGVICFVLSCLVSVGLAICPVLRRRHTVNFFFLTLVSCGRAMGVSLEAALTKSHAFFLACGITAAVIAALTIFVIQTKYNFTGLGPYLLLVCMVLMAGGVICVTVGSSILTTAFAVTGAGIFSVLIVYDTQKVVGGKHRRYAYSVDDYVFAAVTLYMDVVGLFMQVLGITTCAT